MSAVYTYNHNDFCTLEDANLDSLYQQLCDVNFKSAELLHINREVHIDCKEYTVGIYFSDDLEPDEKNKLDQLVSCYKHIHHNYKTAIILDMKLPNTPGGTFESGKWITRTLNIFPQQHNFCSVANNQIILNPGSYHIVIKGSVHGVLGHKMRLQNITNNYTEIYSLNGYAESSDIATIDSFIEISESTIYEVQHICQKTVGDIGFGISIGFNEPDIYCRVSIYSNRI